MKKIYLISGAILLTGIIYWYSGRADPKSMFGQFCGCNKKCSCGNGGDKICQCGSITENSPSGRRSHIRCKCVGEGVCK